eukprot:s27_g17.t1
MAHYAPYNSELDSPYIWATPRFFDNPKHLDRPSFARSSTQLLVTREPSASCSCTSERPLRSSNARRVGDGEMAR